MKKGVELLNSLSNRNVEVILVTRPQTIDLIENKLQGIMIYELKVKSHYKKYIIDDSIIINASSNLTLGSTSIESFKINILNKDKKRIIKQIIESSRRVK